MGLSESSTEKQIQSASRLFAAADKGCVVGNRLKKFKEKSLLNKLGHYLNSIKLVIIKEIHLFLLSLKRNT